MDRKHRNSPQKGNQPCGIVRNVKKHSAGIARINITDYRFEIKQEVIDALKNNVQYQGNEMCGVLMGSHISGNRYRINKISPPCTKKHSPCGCERDAAMANLFIAEDYKQSEHTRFYIGEWHTHPESSPSPSVVDYHSIKDIYQTASLVVPFLLMIIVGTQTFHISVYNGNEFIKVTPQIV